MRSRRDTSLNPNSTLGEEKCSEYEYRYHIKTKKQTARASSARGGRDDHGHAAATVATPRAAFFFCFLHLLFLTHVLLRHNNSKTKSSSSTIVQRTTTRIVFPILDRNRPPHMQKTVFPQRNPPLRALGAWGNRFTPINHALSLK